MSSKEWFLLAYILRGFGLESCSILYFTEKPAIAVVNLMTTLNWSFKKFLSKEGGGGAQRKKRAGRMEDDNCMALALHEQGQWQHHYYNISSDMDKVLNATSIAAQYLPAEIE